MSLTKDQKKQIDEIFQSWEDPVEFVYSGIGIRNRMKDFPNDDLTKQQKNFLSLLGKYVKARLKMAMNEPMSAEEEKLAKKVGFSIRAGQGPGKTTVLSWAILWFQNMFHNSISPCFAPKAQQLTDNLWKEIGLWIQVAQQYGSPLISNNLVIQSDKIYHKDYNKTKEEWAVLAKTVKDTSNRSEQGATARGLHGDFMMVCVDEAPAVKEGLFDVLEGTITGPCNFIIMIGNPIKSSGYFFDTHNKNKKDWVALHWSNEDCERIPKEVVDRAERMWGRTSSHFQVNVLGNFPSTDKDAFIGIHLLDQAFDEDNGVVAGATDPIMVGVDPAGRGKDRTVVCQRRGGVIEAIWVVDGDNEMHIANWLAMYNRDVKPNAIMMDSGGLGGPIAARCEELGLPIYRVNSAESARDQTVCERVRDELLWTLRPWFVNGAISVRLDHDEMNEDHVKQVKKDLWNEISTIKYAPGAMRREKFETKAQHKKRLDGKSPDLLDALALSFYWQDDLFREEVELDGYSPVHDDSDDGSWMSL
jgi:hypothetical protein